MIVVWVFDGMTMKSISVSKQTPEFQFQENGWLNPWKVRDVNGAYMLIEQPNQTADSISKSQSRWSR
jgi:hypothetical protein